MFRAFQRLPLVARVLLTCLLLFMAAMAVLFAVYTMIPDIDTDTDIDASI